MTYTPFEVREATRANTPLVLTCEHATNITKDLASPSEADQPWLNMHWGWDPGAALLTRAIAEHFGAPAIFSRFSRLIIDPNRKRSASDLVRRECEGHALSFNEGIDEQEVQHRWDTLHAPYHDAVSRTIQARKEASAAPFLLFSVHTFTRVYMGMERELELGVLFDDWAGMATSLEEAASARGFRSALNEPYSGANGMMYAPARHGLAHNIPYLELEVRQDLLASAAGVSDVAARVIAALSHVLETKLEGAQR